MFEIQIRYFSKQIIVDDVQLPFTFVMEETKKVEVVISGIAGVFPESDNVEELKELLFNKQSGITLDSRRWPLGEIVINININVY